MAGFRGLAMVVAVMITGHARAALPKAITSCRAAQLYLDSRGPDGRPKGYAYVQLYKEDTLDSETAFSVSVYPHPDFPSAPIAVEGLTVRALKTTLFDTTSEISEGGLGRFKNTHDVYAVKLHLEADEPIDLAGHGDIGGDVSRTDKYVFCTQTTSKPLP